MAQVIVRNLPDEVVARLKARAAGRKRSLEQELREILSEAARPSREEIMAGPRSDPRHDPEGPADRLGRADP